MKKIFITLLTLIIFSVTKGFCLGILVQDISTTIGSASVTKNLNMILDGLGLTTISVTVLDSFIINQNDTSIKIPTSNIFMQCEGTRYQMQYQNPVSIMQAEVFSILKNFTVPIILSVENIGELPYGVYTTQLKFTNSSPLGTFDFVLTLTINIPDKLELSSGVSSVQITLSEDEVFLKEVQIKNITDAQVNIKANRPWELYIDTTNTGNLTGKYFVRVKTKSNISNYQSEQFELKPNKKYLLASGIATILTPATGQFIPTYLTLEYAFQNSQDGYVPEGIVTNPVKYLLESN